MDLQDLYHKLKEAYSARNLNHIALTLIKLYKDKEFGTLRYIAGIISDSVKIEIDNNGKGFSRLMMLYHPDRGEYYRNEIELSYASKNYDQLLDHAHILMLGKIEEITAPYVIPEDIDYSPVYEWDISTDGYHIVDESGNKTGSKRFSSSAKYKTCLTFYEAFKIRMYGKPDINLPTYYLEDMDEIELSQAEIYDLEGIGFCLHTVTLDLSFNFISDISDLRELSLLEELNLSDNRISDIDILSNLKKLKILYLSNNLIQDITALTLLDNLEYVDVSGNKISQSQMDELTELGITVVCETSAI